MTQKDPPDREIDWEAFLNKLTFCYGCGRFGKPQKNKPHPRGWTMLYQPHPEGPPGLHVCSDICAQKVRNAMKEGVVEEPLEMGRMPMMDAEMREHMIGSAMQHAIIDQGRIGELKPEGKYTFECHKCGVTLDPEDRRLDSEGKWLSRGILVEFGCSKCGAEYRTCATGVAGEVKYELLEEETNGETVSGPLDPDQGRGDEARGPDGNGHDPDLRPPDQGRGLRMSRSEDETVPKLKLLEKPEEVPIDELEPKARLGAMIRRARIKREMSLRDLGAATSMDLVVLGEIERGRRPATQAHIQAIAEAMKMHEGPLMAAAQMWHKEHWKDNNELTLEPNGMKVAHQVPPAYRVAALEDELERCIVDLTLARDAQLTYIQSFPEDEALDPRDAARIIVARDQINRLGSAVKRAMSIKRGVAPGVGCGNSDCEAAGECQGHTETPG